MFSLFNRKKENKRTALKYRSEKCLNCGTPLDVADRYCHYCGQVNSSKRISFKDFVSEFFANIISYDSRLWQTIFSFFIPGKISEEYINGKRTKYANPFRFFLMVSILFFVMNGLLLEWNSPFEGVDKEFPKEFKNKENMQEIQPAFPWIKDSSLLANPIYSHEIQKESQDTLYYSEKQLDSMPWGDRLGTRMKMYNDYFDNKKEYSAKKALTELKHEDTWWNRKVYERVAKFDNIEVTFYDIADYIIAKLPLIIFFFLPLFAILLGLLYIRQPFNYMEHLVFTFHQQTVFFILFGIGTLVSLIFKTTTPRGILSALFLIYLYKAMRKFYKQNHLKTIVKFLLANLLFFTLAIVGVVFTFLGAAILF